MYATHCMRIQSAKHTYTLLVMCRFGWCCFRSMVTMIVEQYSLMLIFFKIAMFLSLTKVVTYTQALYILYSYRLSADYNNSVLNMFMPMFDLLNFLCVCFFVFVFFLLREKMMHRDNSSECFQLCKWCL